jgi:DNA-binding response OmpR family regulator
MNSHILLVEDQHRLAQIVEMELADRGYEVSVSHDGRSGLSAAQNSEPDLIILDWCLPGLSGLEICQRLRKLGSRVPIIFVTAMDSESDRQAGLKAGANAYMVKPFDLDQLVAKVDVLIQCAKSQLNGTQRCCA